MRGELARPRLSRPVLLAAVVALSLPAIANAQERAAAQPVALGKAREYGVASGIKHSAVSADFDGDGRNDLAVSSLNTSVVSILMNAGGGRFTRLSDVSSALSPWLGAHDVTGDGWVDLIAVEAWSGIAVQAGNGDGSFQPPIFHPPPPGSIVLGCVLADFDADGMVDVGTSFVDSAADTERPAVAYGAPGGMFGPLVPYAEPVDDLDFTDLNVGDVDDDGRPDLVTGGSTFVRVYRNLGDRLFDEPSLYPAGAAIISPQIGDVTGDRVADIVVANDDASKTLRVLPGRSDGTFDSAETLSPLQDFPDRLALADLDGDGALEILVKLFGADSFAIGHREDGGAFSFAYFAGRGDRGPIIADHFNRGGQPDVMVAESSTVSVRLNRTPVA